MQYREGDVQIQKHLCRILVGRRGAIREFVFVYLDTLITFNWIIMNLSGQWLEYFKYGPEYGDEIYGEKVHLGYSMKK